MPRVVRAFPLKTGMEQALRGFSQECRGSRAGETSAFYRGLGVSRETWHLQENPGGTVVIVCTDMFDHVRTAASVAGSTQAFHTWFKGQIHELSGLDPDREPLGPPSVTIFEWPPTGAK